MEKALQLVISQQSRDAGDQARKVPILRPACVETAALAGGSRVSVPAGSTAAAVKAAAAIITTGSNVTESLNGARGVRSTSGIFLTNIGHGAANGTVTSPSSFSSNKPTGSAYGSGSVGFDSALEAVAAENSPSVMSTGLNHRPKPPCSHAPSAAGGCHADPVATWAAPASLLKVLDTSVDAVSPLVVTLENGHHGCGTGTPLGVSESSDGSVSSSDDDLEKGKTVQAGSSDSAKDEKRFFRAAPRTGQFLPLIDWLLRRGERGDIGAPAASRREGTGSSSSGSAEVSQATFFNEDYIAKLCAAATRCLAKEPTLLELEVLAHDTLVVVGDIHGQFQDLYTSVLCQQYDRRRCNPDGRDRRFLFMGDYVDRGPHSLEVVLLLLALKVEYPTLVYLTRGNHEEEKTSRVYGFLTEATSSLGAEAGAAVWSAVNKVFLDLPLSALVTTPRVRFLVMHGGLSPALQTVEQIAAIDRHAYNTGELSKEAHDIVDGLLWSDPCISAGCYAASSRGCGWNFGPAASATFCSKNRLNFICRAHQLAMDGYFWTHNDRVVTVFSAPNYCGINDNRGAVMVVSGEANKPSFEQYDYYEDEMDYPCPDSRFPYSSYFC